MIMESPRPARSAHRFGSVKVADAVAVAGHEVHVCRYREAHGLAEHWPNLYRTHCERYHVKRTYSHQQLTVLLAARGLDVTQYRYQFRSR